MTLDRKVLGVRSAYVAVAVAVWFGTLFVLAQFPALDGDKVFDALQWLIGMLGVGITGDTLRPSGQKAAAFGVIATTPADPSVALAPE